MGFNFYTNIFVGFLVFLFTVCCSSMESITSSEFIKDPEMLSSSYLNFTLGFFSPENSTNRYLGIWYLSESNVIWVANRDRPLMDSSGLVTISEDGNLVALNEQKQILWSSNVSNITNPSSSIATLLDTGNLVLKDNTTGTIMWESFQHPCDSFVPEMKLYSKSNKLTSWKSPSDPSIGNFSATLEHPNAPEVFVRNGSLPYWRTGPWNKLKFLGLYWFKASDSYLNGFNIQENQGDVYITFDYLNKNSEFVVLKLDSMGIWSATAWRHQQKAGTWRFPNVSDKCEEYGKCGKFGSCNRESSPICSCLPGFEPKNLEEWNMQNWTSGCVRRAPLQCERLKHGGGEADKQDGFMKLEMMNVPDFIESSKMDQEDKCRTQCMDNCSCLAYAYDATIGCMSWSAPLIDIQKFPRAGVNLNIRLSNSEFVKNDKSDNKRKSKTAVIVIAVTIGTIAVAVCAYFFRMWSAKHARKSHSKGQTKSTIGEIKQIKLKELPLLDFEQIITATNNFHSTNKLGQGGFGPVYKGELQNGQQIAVKRLSTTSGQGLKEFMNEVSVISKLQHRNLVKLLGCCVQRDEKILIYEYMPNKSLDAIIFDPQKAISLDWRQRFNIIEGVSRGLLYLHRDSRLKIIHRDLKAGNILLDNELNAKISDFGLAKIFAASEDEANTRRIVGTYGYMSPEYAMEGLVSEKSDVYSFGVLLLEIVSRRKNTRFYNNELSLSLLGFAWKLWNEGNIISLIDSEICDPRFHKDILRCIHIGLLCVQEFAKDRPTVTSITSMLSSEIDDLPLPKEPAYTRRQAIPHTESTRKRTGISSLNDFIITEIQCR